MPALYRRGSPRYLTFISLILFLWLCSCSNTPTDPDAGRLLLPDSVAEVGPVLPVNAVEEKAKVDQVSSGVSSLQSPTDEKLSSSAAIPVDTSSKTKGSAISSVQKSPAPENVAIATESESSSTATQKTLSNSKDDKESKKVIETADLPQQKTPAKNLTSQVKGRVRLIGDDNEALPAHGIFVSLIPEDNNMENLQRTLTSSHVIDMKDKTYTPRFLTIKANDKVSFVNKDPIKHNVFSSTGKNAFDLGTYEAGLKRSVTLKEEGVVKVYCNIHPEMATFISVTSKGYSMITGDNGGFAFYDVPLGRYTMKLWHIRGEMSLSVEVKGSLTQLSPTMTTAGFIPEKRVNKFGNNYDKNTDLFADEFY